MSDGTTYYEVIMVDPNCPDEACSFGSFPTMESAEAFAVREKVHYQDRMEFLIEPVWSGINE